MSGWGTPRISGSIFRRLFCFGFWRPPSGAGPLTERAVRPFDMPRGGRGRDVYDHGKVISVATGVQNCGYLRLRVRVQDVVQVPSRRLIRVP